MNEISITITANSWPEIIEKVCAFAATQRPSQWHPEPYPAQPMYAAPAPTAVPTAPVTPTTSQTAPVAPVPAPAPTTAPTYTLDQLAYAATPLVDAGRQTELQQLLASFGVRAVTELPKEQYGAFATALRGMGAKL